MKNSEIAKIFDEIAEILEILDENPFRIRAYRKAARSLEALTKPVEELSSDELQKIPGIGKDLSSKINEFIQTGKLTFYEELKNKVPEGVLEITKIPGVGPKTARLLYETLKITDIEKLEQALSEGKLKGLPGFGIKTEENIRKGISMIRKAKERKPIARVLPIAKEIVKLLKDKFPNLQIKIAGSIRRWRETVKDIDIVCATKESEKVINYFISLPVVKELLARGTTKVSVVLKEGVNVDLRLVDESSFGAAVAYFTGSKEHNIRLREMAKQRGLKINEYGVFKEPDEIFVAGQTEEEIYRVLGLPWIPPELREDRGEIEAAQEGRLPDLIEKKDIKGDFHIHSNYSDGANSIEEIVIAALKKGYHYIAITDHSKGLGVAKGLSEERILAQKEEIERVRKRYPELVIFHGIEVNILPDGSLDLSDDILKELDIVIGSVHSAFKQTEEEMTERIIKALKNPYVHIIGHPTGRLLIERPPYNLNIDEIIKVAKEYDKFLEINSYPLRMDLNDINARKAKEAGVKLVINTDAHSVMQLDFITYGVAVARRAWLEKNDILNTYETAEVVRLIKRN